jgi:MFS family permease
MPILAEYLRQFGRFQRNARLYLISNALSGVTIGIILVLYNLYLTSLGYGPDFVGLVLFVLTIGIGVAIFPAGICVDRFGGKAILIWSSVAIGISGAGQILLRQPVPLLVSSFLAGVASAFVYVVNAPFLTANSTPAERSHLFSLNIVLTLVTTVLGELLGGILPVWFRDSSWLMAPSSPWFSWLLARETEPRSYQLALLLAGIIALPSFFPLFLLSDDRSTVQTSISPEHEHVPLRQRVHLVLTRWRPQTSIRTLLVSPIVVLTVVQVLVGMGAGLFIPYFNLYFVRHLGASSALFGVIDGSANALNALMTLLAPLLAARIGKIHTITITRIISLPLLLTIGFSHFLPLVSVLYLFRQSSMDMSAGIFQVFSMEAIPRQHRGLANSVYQVAAQASSALTTPLGGLIIARFGYPFVFVPGAILYFIAIGLLWARFRHSDDEERESQEGQHEEATLEVSSSDISSPVERL